MIPNLLNVYKRIDVSGECWVWTGGIGGQGYGYISWRSKGRSNTRRVHRLVYEIFYGNIPADAVVRHDCDSRLCCKPTHLRLGTQLDNIRDRQERNRQAKGERFATSKLTVEQVKLIRDDPRGARPVALDYGVARSLVQRIRQGRLWKHVS